MRPLKIAALALGLTATTVGYVACFHDASFGNHEVMCSTDPDRACPPGSACVDNYCFRPDLLGVDASFLDIAAFASTDGGSDAGD